LKLGARFLGLDAGIKKNAFGGSQQSTTFLARTCGCGAPLLRDAIRLNTDLLRESPASRHSRHIISAVTQYPG
jgi:hypothetical protein